ncbi:MAG TPA: serpin family protein, partial [Symbiobacteriaceae bacterium]|nr:serpin family protein [Symbiobacteriaceae bacterium]
MMLRRLIPLLILIAGLPGCAGLPAGPAPKAATSLDQRLIQAETRFGLGLFHAVRQAEEPGKNIFLSPASASLALSLTYNGARGATQQAMAQALSVAGMTPDEVNQANEALQTILANPDPKVRVEIANSLWYKQGLTVNKAFLEAAQKHYRAEVKPVAFGKAGAEKPINQWVARATQDRIKSIIDGTEETDRMYLINAIYFNGTWQEPFYEESTRPQRFTRADGTTKEHPFMNQGGRYRYLKGENFQAAALPYGDGRMNLYVFVPDQGVTLGKFYESLTPENWDSWMSRFALKQGSVAIPKLKLDYEKKLNDALKNLG